MPRSKILTGAIQQRNRAQLRKRLDRSQEKQKESTSSVLNTWLLF